MNQQRQRYLSIALVFLVPLAVYSLTRSSGYILDDNLVILKNPWLTDVSYIFEIFTSADWDFKGTATKSNYYRPVMYLIFMGEYHLFGLNPAGFHLVSALIHSLNTVMVFLVASFLMAPVDSRIWDGGASGGLGHPSNPERKLWLPVLTALLFALHPVNSEAIAWISSLSDLTYSFFTLTAFYLYIMLGTKEGNKRYLYALSIFCFFIALLCKETAITFLFFIWVYDFLREDRRIIRRYLVYLPYILMVALYMALRLNALGGMTQHQVAKFTLLESILYMFPLVLRYFGKLVYPAGLTAIYPLHPVLSISEPLFIAGLLFTCALIGTIIYLRKRPKPLFSLLWIIFPLLPVMYAPLVSLGGFGDRYLYLSSAGFAMVVTLLLSRSLSIFRSRAQGLSYAVNIARIGVLVILLIYTTATISRIYVWSNKYSFWTDIVKKNPTSPIANTNLGIAYQKKGELDKSIEYFKKTIELAPGYYGAYNNIGNSYLHKGQFKKSMVYYKKSLKINFNRADTHYNLGLLYETIKLDKKAAKEYEIALKLDPNLNLAKERLLELSKR